MSGPVALFCDFENKRDRNTEYLVPAAPRRRQDIPPAR